MKRDVELRIVHPYRVGQVTRDCSDLLSISRNERDALFDQLDQALVVEDGATTVRLAAQLVGFRLVGRLEHQETTDMHRRRAALEIEERDV
jgi:hypothetical protein